MSKVLIYDYPGSICSQMARLALEEKGITYTRQTIDIINTHEQFEPWYIALNPKSVVPTLRIDDLIVTDTINIVKCIDSDFDGPSLSPVNHQFMEQLMTDIMGLHYGVLLYSGSLTPERTSPTIIARGKLLEQMLLERPQHSELLQKRVDGNRRMQDILSNDDEVERYIDAARSIVDQLDASLAETEFVAGDQYSLADTFATAAIARFRKHGFENWWIGGRNPNVSRYINAMRERPSWIAAGIVDS